MKSSRRLRRSLFLYLATALLALVLSLVLTISLTLFDHLKKAEDRSMLHAAQTRAMTIAEWCRRAKDLARQITSRSRIRQELEKFNQGEISLEEVRAFTEPKLQDAMDMSKDIIGILRLDAKHHIIAACGYGSELPIMDKAVKKYILNDIDLLDPLTVNGRLSIVLSAPIRTRNGERQGTDLVVLNTDSLQTIASNSIPMGRTSSIFIGYQSKNTIAYLFPIKRRAIELQLGLNLLKAIKNDVSKAIAGQTGIENIFNTLVAYTPVTESNWAVVLTQNESELYGSLYRKMATIGILFLLIYLLIVFGFGCVMKPLAGRILFHADDLERKIEEKTAVLEKEIDRRTHVENRLREKERFLASVFDAIQDGICVLTPDLEIVRTNKAMKVWYGEHVPMEGKSCFEVFHANHQSCTECPVLRSIKSRKLEMKEIPLIQGDGVAGVFDVYAFPMLDDDGMVTGIVQYVRDVSRQKHTERELRDLTRKLETAQQLAKSGWWEYDISNDAVIWPGETYVIFGLEPDTTTLDYNRLLRSIPPDYHDSFYNTIQLIFENGTAEFQCPIVIPNGEHRWLWIKGEAVYDENGKPIRLFGTLQDITECKQAEQALADSEQRLANIIDFLPDPTWVIDNNSRVIEWNHAIERLTGIKKNDIIGKRNYAYAVPFWGKPTPVLIDFVLNSDSQWENEYLSLKERDKNVIEGESFHPHMGNEGLYLSGIAGRLYNSEGDVVGAIESVRDISAAKRLEKEHEQLIIELKEAIAQVRTLSGLLPMCAKCKKIRDDGGYWNQLETYILQHTDVDISHGLCPECMDEIYGGEDWYKKGR